jgi:hypothetical protein
MFSPMLYDGPPGRGGGTVSPFFAQSKVIFV